MNAMPLRASLRLFPALVLAVLPASALGGGNGPALLGGPLNIDPGRSAAEVRLAVTPEGAVVVAWTEDTRKPGDELGRGVFVKRWRGGRWEALGDSLNYLRERNAASLDLALDERGAAVLAWNENYGHADIAVFRALTPSGWTDWNARRIGQDLTYAGRTRSLAARKGEPILAWGDLLRGNTGTVLRLKRWRKGAWATGAPFSNDPGRYAFAPSLALNGAGEPTVAWLEGDVAASDVLVKRWANGAWQPLGGPLNVRRGTYTFSPALRLDRAGRPVVAWLEDVNGTDTLFVKRWTGQTWEALGSALNIARPAETPSLALAPNGAPLLAWTEEVGGVGRVYAKRWTGTRWDVVAGGALNLDARQDARSPTVGVNSQGTAFLAWREQVKGVYQVRVRRLP